MKALYIYIYRERERERDRQTERQTDRERQRDRERDRERISEKSYNNFFATLSFIYFTIFKQMSDVITNIPT